MIVMKFGGTSVEDSKAIARVASIVAGRRQQRPAVVVSAMGGVTDVLIAMAKGAAAGDLPGAMKSLQTVQERHLKACEELRVPPQAVSKLHALFDALEVVLRGIAALGELSGHFRDHTYTRFLRRAFAQRAYCDWHSRPSWESAWPTGHVVGNV